MDKLVNFVIDYSRLIYVIHVEYYAALDLMQNLIITVKDVRCVMLAIVNIHSTATSVVPATIVDTSHNINVLKPKKHV